MIHTEGVKPAKRFGPGYFIREQMELRNWTQDDLSGVTGFTVKHLNKVLQDRQPLTIDMAWILGEVFHTSAQYWINLDMGYRLWLKQNKTRVESEADIKGVIYERMPVKDMISKGWLQSFKNADELRDQVIKFWDWDTLDFSILDRKYIPCLTRKSIAYNQFNASYALSWYRKARMIAGTFQPVPYEKKSLRQLFDELHAFSSKKEGITTFLKELNQTGVIFFVLPHLQKTYLDGAAFFMEENPVIVYTARYRRVDNFWFTVAHEIAHVLLHLNGQTPFILDNLKDGDRDEMEIEANASAAKKLRHKEILDYLNPYLGYLSVSKIEECAATYRVHPSIVIGKLAYDKRISYRNLSRFNEDVTTLIPKNLIF